MWGSKEFHILAAEIWKAREPNERLWHITEREWLADECVDLAARRVYDSVKARRGMADDRYAVLYRLKRHPSIHCLLHYAAHTITIKHLKSKETIQRKRSGMYYLISCFMSLSCSWKLFGYWGMVLMCLMLIFSDLRIIILLIADCTVCSWMREKFRCWLTGTQTTQCASCWRNCVEWWLLRRTANCLNPQKTAPTSNWTL